MIFYNVLLTFNLTENYVSKSAKISSK